MLLAGVAGLGESLGGMATQLLPRQFSARQQQQILDWEVGNRWRQMSAGQIFPAAVTFRAPYTLGGGTQPLTATRIGIARQASCPKATDAAVAAVLTRNGCEAMLRATYVDATDSYVVTVGVAAFPAIAQASAAHRELAGAGARDLGVQPVPFTGTPAAGFTNGRRQLSADTSAGTYVVFYTIGYTDGRPHVTVASDRYVYSEMTSLGAGVTQAVVSVLAAPERAPHCPGSPGC